jgi:hypothetical protein
MATAAELAPAFTFVPSLTKHVSGHSVRVLQHVISRLLTAFQVSFYKKSACHFDACAWYPLSGFAKFSVHIWRRADFSSSNSFAVELTFEHGDQLLAASIYKRLSGVLDDPDDAIVEFDERLLFKHDCTSSLVPTRSPVSSKLGECALLRLISSSLDRVAGQGCLAAARVAASCPLFLHSLSTSFPRAIAKVAFRPCFSLETRTAAMMALSVFSALPLTVSVLHSWRGGSVYCCVKGFGERLGTEKPECVVGHVHQYYAMLVVLNILAALAFDDVTASYVSGLCTQLLQSPYAPLREVAARGLLFAKI